jgi:hemerythrin-like domain-containing protein
MHVSKGFRNDQEMILRFLEALGGGSAILSSNKRVHPSFFIFAHTFIHEYIEEFFFKKEEFLIKALEDNGFPTDDGPIVFIRTEQGKSREAAEHMINAARGWQAGDEEARAEVGWAASEFTSSTRQHMNHLKNRIFPLLDQNMSPEDEHRIAEGLNAVIFENGLQSDTDKYVKLIESLEEELRNWK